MGSEVIKIVRGQEYRYYSYYSNGKKYSTYCGLASDPKSKVKLKDVKINELQTQKEEISIKIKELRNQ